MLSVLASGGVRGVVVSEGRFWVVATPAGPGATPAIAEVPAHRLAERRDWKCGADQLERPPLPPGWAPDTAPAAPEGATYSANVAIETDYEFFQLFGNTTAELDYIADLFAYSSSIYTTEVNTGLAVGYVSLWTTPADPWSAGSTSTMLDQFRNYWISNHPGVVRTIAHFLGGRSLGGGIAYVGALCSNSFGYGLSMDLDGNFDIGNPGIVWASDAYRIRAWDTTLSLARFNNSSTQVTVLVIQNAGSEPVTGSISYWGAAGTLLASQPFTAAGRSTFVANTSAVPVLQGKSGSATVSHDGRHGALAGKAVSVEPATGFTFDTPIQPRPR